MIDSGTNFYHLIILGTTIIKLFGDFCRSSDRCKFMGERLIYYSRKKEYQQTRVGHTVEEIDRGYQFYVDMDTRFSILSLMLRSVKHDDSSSEQTDSEDESLPDLEEA